MKKQESTKETEMTYLSLNQKSVHSEIIVVCYKQCRFCIFGTCLVLIYSVNAFNPTKFKKYVCSLIILK